MTSEDCRVLLAVGTDLWACAGDKVLATRKLYGHKTVYVNIYIACRLFPEPTMNPVNRKSRMPAQWDNVNRPCQGQLTVSWKDPAQQNDYFLVKLHFVVSAVLIRGFLVISSVFKKSDFMINFVNDIWGRYTLMERNDIGFGLRNRRPNFVTSYV